MPIDARRSFLPFPYSLQDLNKFLAYIYQHAKINPSVGFTPENCQSYPTKEISGDNFLFIQKGKTVLFKENKLMFPLLSHA